MWRHVDLVRTDVSEERVTSIFGIETTRTNKSVSSWLNDASIEIAMTTMMMMMMMMMMMAVIRA
jgi:hypothetical protein